MKFGDCVFCGGTIEPATVLLITRYSCRGCWPPKEEIQEVFTERNRLRRALEKIAGVPLTERGFSEALNIARTALLADK